MRRTAAVVLTMSAALCAGAWTAAAQPGHKDERLVAPVDLQPFGGEGASGVARITAAPGEPARIIAVLIGLTADPTGPSGTTVSLALGRSSCGELAQDPDASALRRVGPPLPVSPDGTAVTQGVWDDTDIVHVVGNARSLALVGDWDGDGLDRIGACGDVEALQVVRNARAAEGLLVGTQGAAAQTGEGLILGNLLTSLTDGRSRVSAVFAGLAPAAQHHVGVSGKTCAALKDDASKADLRRIGGFASDAAGAAHITSPFDWRHDVGRTRPRSVVVVRDGPAGPSVAMCQPARSVFLEAVPGVAGH